MQNNTSQYWVFKNYINQEPWELREKRSLLAGIKLVAFNQ